MIQRPLFICYGTELKFWEVKTIAQCVEELKSSISEDAFLGICQAMQHLTSVHVVTIKSDETISTGLELAQLTGPDFAWDFVLLPDHEDHAAHRLQILDAANVLTSWHEDLIRDTSLFLNTQVR